MKIWRILPLISGPMPFQMALDEIHFRRFEQSFLRKEAPQPVLRFFMTAEAWVSSGYAYSGWGHGKVPSADGGMAQEFRGYPRCRRLTGGGYVLHQGDLMFSLIVSKNEDERLRSVKTSYGIIHEALRMAFRRAGRETRFYRCDERLPSGSDCFLFPIASDLGWKGRKIAGGGQKRSSGVLLHQESVRRMPGLDPQDLLGHISEAVAEVFGAVFVSGILDPEELEEARTLGKEKYEIPLKGAGSGRA